MLSDLRFAFRQLVKSPGFTIIAIVALALGVATSTTMFTFYNALILRPVPFVTDEGTLLTLKSYDERNPQDTVDSSILDFRDIRQYTPSLASALTVMDRTYIFGTDDHPDRALGSWITVDAFQTLGVQPQFGRLFHPEEAKAGSPQVAILSHALWKKSFGGSSEIIGQVVTLNSAQVTIVGVMPEGFAFPRAQELWQPFPDDQMTDESYRDSHGLPTYARLKPGRTRDQAQAELEALALRLEKDHPKTNTGRRFRATPFHEEAVYDKKLGLQFMMGAVIAVLLIACGNVASLLLARGTARCREIAIRAALGAGRGRLIRQMLTESLLLGLVGGAAGLLLAFWQIDFVLSFIPIKIPFWMHFDLDWRVLGFVLIITISSSVLFGLFPALHVSKPDLTHELKDGARGGTVGGDSQRFRSYLVVAQLAITLVLLVVAGLMTRSFLHLQNTDTGMDVTNVFTFRTGIPPTIEKDEKVWLKFFEETERQLRTIPGVEHAGFINYLPGNADAYKFGFSVEGRPAPKTGDLLNAYYRSASPGVFPTLRIPLIRGRYFDEHDRGAAEKPNVIVVSQSFVRKFFPNEDPLGRRLILGDAKTDMNHYATIVGVVGDIKQRPSSKDPEPSVWCPIAQKPDSFLNAVLRVPGNPDSYEHAAQEAVVAARPGIPIYYPASLQKVVNDAMWEARFAGGLFLGFGCIALFLASLGIYGVMAYSVAQRTQEIGVRMALGAEPASVIGMVLKQGLLLVGVGLVLGFISAWFVAQLLTSLLHGIEPHDPPTFACVPLLLALVALAACWFPSRRATRVDPNTALRGD